MPSPSGRCPSRSDPRECRVVPSPMDFAAERLITHRNAGNVVVEQYRRLAGILHQAQVERGVKVVMLASAQAAEGKTLTAVNLALTLSESYKRRVLLIDADLRRPSVGRVFGLPPASGLSECLKSSELQALRITNVTDSLGLAAGGNRRSRSDVGPHVGPHARSHRAGCGQFRLGDHRYAACRPPHGCPPAGGDGRCGGARHRRGHDAARRRSARDRKHRTRKNRGCRAQSRRTAGARRSFAIQVLRRCVPQEAPPEISVQAEAIVANAPETAQ